MKKGTESSNEQFAAFGTVADGMPIPLLLVRWPKIVFGNKAFAALIGSSDGKELSGKSAKNLLARDSYKRLQEILPGIGAVGSLSVDLMLNGVNGEEIPVKAYLNGGTNGNSDLVQVQLVDQRLQNQAIDELRHARLQMEEILSNTLEGVAVLDEGRIAMANPAFSALLGYPSPDQLKGVPYDSLTAESDRERVTNAFAKMAKKKTLFEELTCQMLRQDGTDVPVAVQIKKIQTVGGQFILYHRDNTGLQALENKLDRSERESALLARFISHVTFSTDLEGVLSSSISTLLEIMPMEAGGVYLIDPAGKQFELAYQKNLPEGLTAKIGSPAVDEGLGGYFAKTLEAQYYPIASYPSYLPFRTLFKEQEMKAVAYVPAVVSSRCIGFILLTSKRKHAGEIPSAVFFSTLSNELGKGIEAARSHKLMKASEEQYRTLLESVNDVLFRATPEGNFVYISPAIERLAGYEQKEFYRNKTLWLSLVHREDKKFLLERTANLETLGSSTVYEYRVRPKGKAAYRWIRETTSIIRDENGVIVSLDGILSDITNYKNLAEELVQSNELNDSILSSVHEGVVVFNTAYRCIQWNEAMERITGLMKSETLGRSATELFAPESAETKHVLEEALKQALEGKNVNSEEVRYKIGNTEKTVLLWGRYAPLRAAQGEIIGAVGIITDLSERKVLEEELRESEQALRNVIDTMSDILMITDLKGDVLEVNRAFLNSMGYGRQEVIGLEFPYPWLFDEEMGRYVLWIGTLRDKNWLRDFDMTWKTKDGRLVPMSLSTTLLRNSLGEPIAMVNIARDITERKRLMRDLENRNKEVELLNRIISAANQSMDFESIFQKISDEIAHIVEFDSISVALLEENSKALRFFAGRGWVKELVGEVLAVEDAASFLAVQQLAPVTIGDLQQKQYVHFLAAKHGMRSHISLPIILKDRALGTLNIASAKPDLYSDSQVPILQSIASQTGAIIERTQLFRKVTEDASYIHNLVDSIDSVVYTVDTQYRILEVNKAWFEFIQETGAVPHGDYHGMSIFDALNEESLKLLFQTVGSDILSGVVRFFSQEFVHPTPSGKRIYQVTMNPMVIDRKITGLVISHSDITALKESEVALKKNNEQLIALNEISTLFSTSRRIDDVLSVALPLLIKTIGADAAAVYLVDRTGMRLELAHQAGFKPSSVAMLDNMVSQGSATGVVVGTNEPVFISTSLDKAKVIQEGNRAFLLSEGITSLAIIPLTSKESVLGALNVFYRLTHEFTDQERELLRLIGNQLGSALENAQLYGELRSQIDRLTVLYEFSEHLTSKLEPAQIYEVVADHVARVIPFSEFTIDLLDSNQQFLHSVHRVQREGGVYRPVPSDPAGQRVAKGSPEWQVLETRRAYHDPDFTVLYVPMSSKQMTSGIMAIRLNEPMGYSDTHLRLLESIGNLTAIALEKGKLYEETIQKSFEIERRNQELDDFTYVVSHDLKEPLITIEGFSKILQIDYQESLKGEGTDYLDSIMGASVRMKGLINDLLMLSRVSRPGESFNEFPIAKVINEIKTDMEYTIRQRGVRFIIAPDMPMFFGNETHIKIVFRNLISNALKFNRDPEPVIEVGFQNSENNSYLFYVRDNGIGIEPEFFEKIFVIFQRLHRREDYEGTGAGLAIVKKIIELHKGRIWVESVPGKGSTFYFTLPKITRNE